MGEKLTKAQRETLGLIADGRVFQLNCGYAAWRIQGANPSVVGRLVALGLARWGSIQDDRIWGWPTDAGLRALEQEK